MWAHSCEEDKRNKNVTATLPSRVDFFSPFGSCFVSDALQLHPSSSSSSSCSAFSPCQVPAMLCSLILSLSLLAIAHGPAQVNSPLSLSLFPFSCSTLLYSSLCSSIRPFDPWRSSHRSRMPHIPESHRLSMGLARRSGTTQKSTLLNIRICPRQTNTPSKAAGGSRAKVPGHQSGHD